MSKHKLSMREWASNPANRDEVLKAVSVVGCDGWVIFAPEAFSMIPPEVLQPYNRQHASDNASYKTQITRPDGSIGDVGGVYGLSVLEGIGDALGVDSNKIGRGSRAAELNGKIKKALGA